MDVHCFGLYTGITAKKIYYSYNLMSTPLPGRLKCSQ